MKKIAFAGTDGRTLLWALVVSTATSERYEDDYQGIVMRGTPAMPKFVEMMGWPVSFIPTKSNTVDDYATAIIEAFKDDRIDYLVPMPEALLFEGLVDRISAAGFGDRVLGLDQAGAYIEGDKIKCKQLCREAGIPVADAWDEVDARDYEAILRTYLDYIDRYGGAVLKYPYSAGGKGARIILNAWEIRQVYDTLISDYKDKYKSLFTKKKPWPLLVESLMSGAEISFTILVDAHGHYQILPTAMDYPERFEGPAGKDNPITGGTGAVSPHPMETPALVEMAKKTIAEPLIQAMRQEGILRPCILYPGCFVSLDAAMRPVRIRVSEINIRPGEPEVQPVARRLRNLGALIEATLNGNLHEVEPEVRDDQVAVNIALMTGPGGPDGQKGYPWSCTKGEPVGVDMKYLKRKGVQLIPSAMSYSEEDKLFKSDGTRVAFLNGNITLKSSETRGQMVDRLRRKLLAAHDNGKIRVIPREDSSGNRLDLRRDIGRHFLIAEQIFPESASK
jgi:phosphoribosylamine--glycine ligase